MSRNDAINRLLGEIESAWKLTKASGVRPLYVGLDAPPPTYTKRRYDLAPSPITGRVGVYRSDIKVSHSRPPRTPARRR